MLKRLFVGLVVGVLIGGGVAAALVKGLGVTTFTAAGAGPALAYVSAIVAGVLAGLVAGKPIWAKGAWIEVGLKAFFGSLLAAGAMFALRRWATMPIDLAALGSGPIGELPVTSLPILATVLSIFYELDNTDPPDAEASSGRAAPAGAGASKPNKRVAAPARVAEEPPLDDGDEAEEPKKRMKH